MTALATVAAFAQLAGCLPASGDHITAADMAAAVPEFAAVDPRERLGYTPNPGATRTFRAADLDRLAQRLGLQIEVPHDVCFEWRLRTVEADEVVTAMKKALDNPAVSIEILEISRQPAPEGELAFDAKRLNPPANNDASQPVVWTGVIEYGSQRRFTVWARVRLSAPTQRIVATRPIRAGATIGRDDVRAEGYEGFPHGEPLRLEDVVGQAAVRPLREGMVVLEQSFREAPLVRYGDEVAVTVLAGRAVVKTEGRAEGSGKLGETIEIRNPKSGKTFHAEIIGAGSVRVMAPGG